MKTTISKQNGKLIAILEGTLDTAASEQLARDLSPLADCQGCDIVIDCTRLKYICSSGLRILLGIRKRANVVGSNVTLFGVNDDIRDILHTTGFHNLFNIQ
jgi:anti-sigma B factor antagonist